VEQFIHQSLPKNIIFDENLNNKTEVLRRTGVSVKKSKE